MNKTVKSVSVKAIAGLLAAIAVCVLSCEIPTDGNFGGNIRGVSKAPSLASPKNVRAVEGEAGGTIAITWNAVPGADGYNVYRSKGASSQVSLRGGVSLTEYSDSGKSVAPKTPYYYFVSAYKGALESAMSPSKVIELSIGASGILPAPEITGAEGSDNSITLTWIAVAGAAEYRVYRSSNYDDKQYIFRHNSTLTSFLDTSLMPGQYIYQVSAVSAVDSGGQEGYLSLSSDWVPIEADEEGEPLAVPPAPQSVRARIDGTDGKGGLPSVTLTWQAAAGATKYYVLRSEDGETYTEIGFAEGETSYVNKYADVNFPVGWGGIYYYRVKPYNGTQEGYLSAACGPVVITPAKPEITGVSGTAGNITLNWTIEGKADGFRVYRSANNVQYEILKTVGGNERTYTDTAVGAGTYYYRITAYNSGGVGLDSDPEEVDVAEQAAPSFVPVSGMSGVPDAAVAGVPLTLQGTVQPSNATNKAIVWTVKSAGGTDAAISDNTLTATTTGTVTVTATIANGLAVGSAYTGDFTIAVSFVPVSGMSGVPDAAVAGVPLTLQGTVQPSNATNKAIVWTVKSAGGTDAAISDNTLTATTMGTVTVTATIANGLAVGSAYTGDFTIVVSLSVFNVTDSTTLASALSSIRSRNAVYFTIIVEADFSSPPVSLTDTGYNGKTIVFKGDTPARTVSLASKGSLFAVGEDVTLELEDIVLQGQSSNNKSLVEVNSDGTLMMKSGSKISGNIDQNNNGGGVYVSGGTFTMNGGEINGNTTFNYGGGVYVSGGTFTMNSGEISGNSAFHGGGVWVNSSTFKMNGGEISGNSASGGGGVRVYEGSFTMSDGEISGNSASGGSGVWINAGTFTMSGGEIIGNTPRGTDTTYTYEGVTFNCGGVYVSGGTFTMSGGKITGNSGSGVTINGNITFTMDDGEISGNTSSSFRGGGVRVCSGTFTMNNGKISGNIADGRNGGGVSVDGGTFTMKDGEISGNTATGQNGGGVYVYEGTFTMSGGEISGNTASGNASSGGGVCMYAGGRFTKESGGTIYGFDADVKLRNTAGGGNSYGHAVYITSSKKRNTTAGVGVTLDSTKDGGWE